MKKTLCILLIAANFATGPGVLAAGPAEPWKGDQGGIISAKIEAALAKGEDPSVYVNAYYDLPSQGNSYYASGAGYISSSTYSSFRGHALKWYNNTYQLQRQFGYFEAYFASAMNKESANYYHYGHDQKMTMDQYLLMIIAMNKMPSFI